MKQHAYTHYAHPVMSGFLVHFVLCMPLFPSKWVQLTPCIPVGSFCPCEFSFMPQFLVHFPAPFRMPVIPQFMIYFVPCIPHLCASSWFILCCVCPSSWFILCRVCPSFWFICAVYAPVLGSFCAVYASVLGSFCTVYAPVLCSFCHVHPRCVIVCGSYLDPCMRVMPHFLVHLAPYAGHNGLFVFLQKK